jgi:hypothetical protein
MQHRQHRGGLERGTVVAVQRGLDLHRVNALGQCRAFDQVRGVQRVVGVVNLEADDLATEDIQDQIQVEPPPEHLGGQVCHVPGS